LASSPTPEHDGGRDPAEGEDAPRPRALVGWLGARPLAIAAAFVDAVVRPGPVTPVAGPEPWLLGVTAVRGRVLPVADLRRLVGGSAVEGDGEPGGGWHVVVDDGRRAAALAGLRLRQVAPCAFAEDEAPGGGGWGGGPLPVRGVARLEGDTTRGAEALPPEAALLDVAALLDLVHDPRTDGD
jgi:hypothetical protein